MIEMVGFAAGDVYRLLETKSEASLSDLAKELKSTPALVQMAVGWLAREGKVDVAKKGTGFRVRIVR